MSSSKTLPGSTQRALPGRAPTAPVSSATEERRALLRSYFQACIRHASVDRILETFGGDVRACAADLGLMAYARGIYDSAASVFELGKRVLGKVAR